MHKPLAYALLLAVCLTSCAVIVRSQARQDIHVKPFSLVMTAHMGYGPNRMESVITFARRSDGSYVRTYTDKAPDGEKGTVVEVLDTRKRTFSTQEPFTRLGRTVRYPADADKELLRQAQFWGTCKDFEARGAIGSSESLLGYQVLKTLEFSSGDAVLSEVAPSLDCFPLRFTITAGERAIWEVGESTYKPVPYGTAINEQVVTKVVEGDPPEETFRLPPNFVETSRDDFGAAYRAKYSYEWYGYHVKRYELIYGRRLDSFVERR